jgi:hypothetical protein
MVVRNGALRRALVCLLATVSLAAGPAAALDTVTVVLDQAKVMRLPAGSATIVVGNPLIADVSVQSGGLIVVTGKGYGTTNLLALDGSGAVLSEQSVTVEGPKDQLVVYRGLERESYSCSPHCERRITLGDGTTFFNTTLGQTGTRNSQAQSQSR